MDIKIREVASKDKDVIETIIRSNENFTDEEKWCAAELLDMYLKGTTQGEYLFICAVNEDDKPLGYICYGKTPFADDVYDIYWIVIDPVWQGMRNPACFMRRLGLLKSRGSGISTGLEMIRLYILRELEN